MVLMLFSTTTIPIPTTTSTPAHRSLHDRQSHKLCAHRTHWIRRCRAIRQPTQCDLNPNAEQGRLRNKLDTFAARLLMKELYNMATKCILCNFLKQERNKIPTTTS